VKNEDHFRHFSFLVFHYSFKKNRFASQIYFRPTPNARPRFGSFGLANARNSTLFFSIDSWIFIGKL